MGPSWKILKLGNAYSGFPPILIKYAIESSSYSIHMTDLTHIWTERMNARDIRRRALNADTSIDPSEDVEQMRLFLRYISDALHQMPGTSLDLAYDEPKECLLLKSYTALPEPLEPLRWTMELSKDLPFVLTEEMVVPLLNAQAISNIETTSLLHHLKDKDRIIDKLFDTIKANGISLSGIFPGAPALESLLKSDARQALSKNARGLSVFDEKEWRKDLKHPIAQTSNLDGLLATVFNDKFQDGQKENALPDHGEWWLSVSKADRLETKSYLKPLSQVEESYNSVNVSEFQRQVTPPSLQHTAPVQSPVRDATRPDYGDLPISSSETVRDESTTDDEDDPAAAAAAAATTIPKQAKPSPQHRRNLTKDLEENLTSRPKARSRDLRDVSEPENSHTEGTIPPESNKDPPGPAKPKAKVGKIGGKPKVHTPDHPDEPTEIATANVHQTQPDHRHQHKENHVPSSSSTTSPLAADPSGGQGGRRQGVLKQELSSPIPAEETELQRADRNREQIKRALEAKAAVPAKKKRRF